MNDLRISRLKSVSPQDGVRNYTDDLISLDAREDLGPSDADSDIEL